MSMPMRDRPTIQAEIVRCLRNAEKYGTKPANVVVLVMKGDHHVGCYTKDLFSFLYFPYPHT